MLGIFFFRYTLYVHIAQKVVFFTIVIASPGENKDFLHDMDITGNKFFTRTKLNVSVTESLK